MATPGQLRAARAMRAAKQRYQAEHGTPTKDGRPNPGAKGHEHYSAALMARTLRDCQGIVSAAAKRLGCTQATVKAYIARHESVRRAMEDARSEFVDLAKLKLKQAVTDGEPWAIQYVLNKFGKDQPWLEETPQDGPIPGAGGRLPGPPVVREIVVHLQQPGPEALPAPADSLSGDGVTDPPDSPGGWTPPIPTIIDAEPTRVE